VNCGYSIVTVPQRSWWGAIRPGNTRWYEEKVPRADLFSDEHLRDGMLLSHEPFPLAKGPEFNAEGEL